MVSPENSQPEPGSVEEQLEQEPDYIEKLTWTPLQAETMQQLLDETAEAYATSDENDGEQIFRTEVVNTMRDKLNSVIEEAGPGVSVMYDSLSWEAEERLGIMDLLNPEALAAGDYDMASKYAQASRLMDDVKTKFAQTFEQHSELSYIGDNIDAWTVDPDVHTYQTDRINANSKGNFSGEPHGQNGRWIPETRNGITVWIPRENYESDQMDTNVSDEEINEFLRKEQTDVNSASSGNEQAQEDVEQQLLKEIPDDRRGRMVFARENFTGKAGEEQVPLLRAFLQKELTAKASELNELPEGYRYPNTVAAVAGNAGDTMHFLRATFNQQRGEELAIEDFLRLPFSQVAQEIGLDVARVLPNYHDYFSER